MVSRVEACQEAVPGGNLRGSGCVPQTPCGALPSAASPIEACAEPGIVRMGMVGGGADSLGVDEFGIGSLGDSLDMLMK